ncbi:hypothetical protein HPC49_54590, partial [Pyxidicoccus fallax]|nr:hypothetical protein [Pyxidicoccus fallax]
MPGGGGYVFEHAVLGDGVLSIEGPFNSPDSYELWRYDGAARQGVRLGVIQTRVSGVDGPHSLIQVGSRLLFCRYDASSFPNRPHWELWRTDGTWAGTGRVTDLPASARLTGADTQAFFAYANALWRTDGTAEGTVELKATQQTAPEAFFPVGSRLFFTASDSASGREPWVSDGTEAGTRRLIDFTPGVGSSRLVAAHEHLGTTYLVLQGGPGTWLVRTDGTSGGTVPVLAAPGASWLASHGGALLLAAADTEAGLELRSWLPGTDHLRLVSDFNPGPAPSSPGLPVRVGSRLVLAATTATQGREPFSVPLDDNAPTVTARVTGERGEGNW